MLIPDEYWKGTGAFEGFGLDQLQHRYRWPKNNPSNNYEDTVRLKKDLSIQWKSALDKNDSDAKIRITKAVISDWGGIKGNKQITIEKHAKRSKEDSYFPFQGVASYSKVLGIIDPDYFAILDARVIVSINAIQLLAEIKNGIFFPYLPGRNKITGFYKDRNHRYGFSEADIFKGDSILFNGWRKPEKDDIYPLYLEEMRTMSSRIKRPLYDLEMSLFSDSEQLAILCAKKFDYDL